MSLLEFPSFSRTLRFLRIVLLVSVSTVLVMVIVAIVRNEKRVSGVSIGVSDLVLAVGLLGLEISFL